MRGKIVQMYDFAENKTLLLDFSSGEDNSERNETMKHLLLKAINAELTDIQKEAVLLYYYQDKNIPQIAQITCKNKATVCRILKRARKRLEKVLKYGFEI